MIMCSNIKDMETYNEDKNEFEEDKLKGDAEYTILKTCKIQND